MDSRCQYDAIRYVYTGKSECLGYYVFCTLSNQPCIKACGEDCEKFRKAVSEDKDESKIKSH